MGQLGEALNQYAGYAKEKIVFKQLKDNSTLKDFEKLCTDFFNDNCDNFGKSLLPDFIKAVKWKIRRSYNFYECNNYIIQDEYKRAIKIIGAEYD